MARRFAWTAPWRNPNRPTTARSSRRISAASPREDKDFCGALGADDRANRPRDHEHEADHQRPQPGGQVPEVHDTEAATDRMAPWKSFGADRTSSRCRRKGETGKGVRGGE